MHKYKCYNTILSILLFAIGIAAIALLSCADDNFNAIINQENAYTGNNTIPVINAPIPGNNGLIIVSNITENSAKVQWTFATDNSPSETLQYQVVISQTLTLFSLDEILQSGLLDEDNWSTQPINEFILTSLMFGKRYFVNVCVKDPDKNISIYYPSTFTTKGRIYLFSAGKYTGAMASSASTARQEINELVHKALINNYPALPQDNWVAFISIDSNDAIKNLPDNYSVPADWPVYSPTGVIIAYNWYDLLDGTIIDQLQNVGVCDSYWWSGSLQDGSCDTDYTCSTWTSEKLSTSNSTLAAVIVLNGRSGAHNRNNYEWIYSNDRNCTNSHHLLGLCW
ncbi:MAG: hypothetical protein N3F66_10210 [Spirochaetes bacterium]|nr:hypothetical protein [Spirochaetota bacterium]